ncbi:Kinase D-interacting substrate [Echinococcus granulosus]|uniref:Kinase D-interacting substrate n=1 Tax=Echinococcus granulosus TaxID=6210 RepID=W6U9N2_ECHGR|nr:Kinase D-interacting substrate [Echinococcus granulosus]EUB58083.1 Kinase D-interacting substrate [Echinococcus granulosus]
MLLSAISDLPPSNCSSYQMQVRRQNINGQVLSVCDLAKLRTELHMSFGDWQLFNTFITYLRGVEVSLADRSRNSQTASFAGDAKSSHGSLAISSPYPYSQVLVPPPFVFCNEQSQGRGKNLFDVPVLVQQVPVESNVANARQNTDRTTSDFSFGSGTDELELAWRRDAKPDSLNGNSKYQYTSKESTSRQYVGQGSAIWMEPIDRLSKSTHDLRSINTSRRPQRRQIASRSGERRLERNTRKTEKQVPTSLFQSASSASDHLVQMVPAYISRAPDSSGVIPVWYPTLPRVGEANKLQQPIKMNEGYSSESSSASMDGTYDFPSEYSSGDRHSQWRHVYLQICGFLSSFPFTSSRRLQPHVDQLFVNLTLFRLSSSQSTVYMSTPLKLLEFDQSVNVYSLTLADNLSKCQFWLLILGNYTKNFIPLTLFCDQKSQICFINYISFSFSLSFGMLGCVTSTQAHAITASTCASLLSMVQSNLLRIFFSILQSVKLFVKCTFSTSDLVQMIIAISCNTNVGRVGILSSTLFKQGKEIKVLHFMQECKEFLLEFVEICAEKFS